MGAWHFSPLIVNRGQLGLSYEFDPEALWIWGMGDLEGCYVGSRVSLVKSDKPEDIYILYTLSCPE